MELLGVPLPSSTPKNQIVDGINDKMNHDLNAFESRLNYGEDNSSIDPDPDEI